MNQSQSLYKLIKTLSSSERRYVTIAIKSHKYAGSYLKLFKEMHLQKTYDEGHLKKHFKNEPFIKHFAVIKNQLFLFILTVLRGYHKGSSLDFKLKELLLDASVLHQKMLYTESWQTLQRARQLALKFEDWKVLLEILYKEFMLIPKVVSQDTQLKEFERINRELTEFLDNLNQYEALAHPVILINALLKKHQVDGNIAHSKEMRSLLQLPILKNRNPRQPLRAQMLYIGCWLSYYMNCCEYEKAEKFSLQQIALFEKNTHFIQWIPGNYLIALRDMLTCCFLRADFKAVEKVIAQLKQLSANPQIKKVSGPRFKTLLFSWSFRYEISIAVCKGIRKEDILRIKQAEVLFAEQMHACEASLRLETLLALSSFYYYISDHKKTARLTEKIISDIAINTQRQLAVIATALQIILHFEAGDIDMIKYLTRRIRKFINAEKTISATETMLLEMAEEFIPASYTAETKEYMLRKFFKDFSALKQNKLEKQYYRFFDVCLWLEQSLPKADKN